MHRVTEPSQQTSQQLWTADCCGSGDPCSASAAGGLVFTEPKTHRSRRTVPLPAPLVAALRLHRIGQEEERVTAGPLWRGSCCVFTTPIGTPTDPRNDFRQFKKLLARAGLPSVRVHNLRHTAASLLLAQNVPARVVMEILGQSQIALTMNTYSHVAPEVSREAADRTGRMLWQDPGEAIRRDH